jgi:hypothetical protein
MDPNIVQVKIVEESLSKIEPFVIGLGGVVLGAVLSWLMMRWQIKRSLEIELKMRKDAEKVELQNLYRVLKTGVTGYLKYMNSTVQNIKSADNSKPIFFYANPATHRLPGYEEVFPLIMKISDVTLLEAVMATSHSIRDFGATLQMHNDWFREYNRSMWHARRTNDEVDTSEAEWLLQVLSKSTNNVKERFQGVEDNITHLSKLLDKSATPAYG